MSFIQRMIKRLINLIFLSPIILRTMFLCIGICPIAIANAQTDPLTAINIKVGAGIRPPFLISTEQGMGPEILDALNIAQDKFNFELVPTPISRRGQSIKEGWVDIVMWDNIKWGWDISELGVSIPLLYSKDVFISHVSPEKSQDYFESFNNKQLCGVNGYHYRFLNYQTNIEDLLKQLEITLVRTEEESIKMALHKRCDISIASESAIAWFLTQYADYKNQLLVSDKFDTEYTRNFLIPSYAAISVEELNSIIKKANQLNLLTPIYQKYGQVNPIE
ncbi:substrate-binding periplasmic protein [Colwellia sp. MEBiC06753]